MSTRIESVLGPSDKRYLGSGWRRTTCSVDVTEQDDTHISGCAGVSIGEGPGRDVHHLSSIDVVAIVDLLLRSLRPKAPWAVTHLDVRTPAHPESTDGPVPVSLRLDGEDHGLTTYTGTIGGFPVAVSGTYVGGLDSGLSDPTLPHPVTDVGEWDSSSATLIAEHEPEVALPLCNVIAIVGELIETTIVAETGRSREELGAIWMRRIEVSRAPTVRQTMRETTVTLDRLRYLTHRGRELMDIHARVQLSDSATVRVKLGVTR